MAARYLHVEALTDARPRHAGAVCGDGVTSLRDDTGTTVLLCDGLGHGLRANMAALLCLSRLTGLLRAGYSLHRAVASVAGTMAAVRGTGAPYAAFTALRILNGGDATVLGYEMPGAVLLGDRHAALLQARPVSLPLVTVMESHCFLKPGEGVLLVSDGITQAGIGFGLKEGWTAAGVAEWANRHLQQGGAAAELPALIQERARELCRGKAGDDCTVTAALCRVGRTLTILTGPPADPSTDQAVVRRFFGQPGWKVVCGGTTAAIVAARLGRTLKAQADDASLRAPPRYEVEGIDLVTEGAVTLNQVYNLLDTDPEELDEDSGVTELLALLRAADQVRIMAGQAVNPASKHVSFRQQGILTRASILPLLVAKLKEAGKRVVVEKV